MVNLYGARFPIKDCQRFCKNLGTQITSVSNTQKLGRLLIFCDEKMKDISDSQWLAVDDIDEEGVWKDSFTGQPLNYTPPWMDGQPNGGRGENCAILSGCSWFDSPCNNDLRYESLFYWTSRFLWLLIVNMQFAKKNQEFTKIYLCVLFKSFPLRQGSSAVIPEVHKRLEVSKTIRYEVRGPQTWSFWAVF